MPELAQWPDWLGAAVMSAVLAALGYVGKQFLDWFTVQRQVRTARQASLVELHSLLRAAWASFAIQNSHAQRLLAMVQANHPGPLPLDQGYERVFTTVYPQFLPEERELHALIRSLTVNSLRPVNQRILDWLQRDVFFKAQGQRPGDWGEMARQLAQLETHLLLWHAKYEAWIPNQPEHALVYMADEQAHGMAFPTEIDGLVHKVLTARPGFAT